MGRGYRSGHYVTPRTARLRAGTANSANTAPLYLLYLRNAESVFHSYHYVASAILERNTGYCVAAPSRSTWNEEMSRITPARSRRSAFHRPAIIIRRVRTRRLTVGRWPRQREIIVVTIKTLILREVAA